MIRINLLSEGRRPVVARRARARLGFGDTDPSIWILAAGLLVGLLVFGIWWFLLSSEVKQKSAEIREKRQEVEELRPIIEEVEEFKRRKEDRKRKIDVIKDLKRKQRGPVHIMDQVSKALPDLLWLEQMSVQGSSVNLRGRAFNTNAVAAFIESLDEVEEFKEPDTKDVQANRGRNTYSFHVIFNFVQQKTEEESLEAADPEAIEIGATDGDVGEVEAAE